MTGGDAGSGAEPTELLDALARGGTTDTDGGSVRRRPFLNGVLSAALLASSAAGARWSAARPASETAWPMYRGDSAHTGDSNARPPSAVTRAWASTSIEVDRYSDGATFPAVADGRVYLVGRTGSSGDWALHAFAAADGTELWDAPFRASGRRVEGTPAIAGGLVLVRSGGGGPALHAVDADTGTQRWQFQRGAPMSDPTVVGGTVYVTAGTTVYALSAADGSVEWAETVPGTAESDLYRPSAVPTVSTGRVFVHLGDTITALDRDVGTEDWRRDIGGVTRSLAVARGRLIVLADDLHALDATDGSTQWMYGTSTAEVSAPLVADGRVHVVLSDLVGDPPTGLHALDAASGTRAWVNETIVTGEGEPPSSPVMAGGVIFVGDVVGTLYAVDPGTGSVRWTHDTGWSAVVYPAVTDGRVYVTGLPNFVSSETAFGVLEEPDSEPTDRVITITGDGESANYEFTVGESLEPNPSQGEFEDDNDTIAGTLANGWVTDPEHADSYRFTGDVVDFHFDEGRATVTLDGASVDPDTLGKSLPNVLVVRGEGEPTNYEFTVSEWLASDADGPALELDNDRIDGRTANGWVTEPSHEDGYRFRGSLTDARFLRGAATVLVNGRDVTDRFLDDDDARGGSVLTVRGQGEPANYEFTVSGSLEANPSEGELERDNDTISGSIAGGWVTDPEHVDSYRFTGDVVDFHFDRGRASVTIDGTSVDPDDVGKPLPRTLRVAGTGEPANYEFTVSERLASDAGGPDLELANDRIDGQRANGWVTETHHEDGFRFAGRVTAFRLLEGEVRVWRDGERVAPGRLGD